MIHNLIDAATAVPLAIAFLTARRPPSARLTYGYGRLEDLVRLAIVLTILGSALAVSYKSIERLLNFRPVMLPGAVAAAGVIGLIANEAVAIVRTRAGAKR